jgi:hypothetical protein
MSIVARQPGKTSAPGREILIRQSEHVKAVFVTCNELISGRC